MASPDIANDRTTLSRRSRLLITCTSELTSDSFSWIVSKRLISVGCTVGSSRCVDIITFAVAT